MHGCPCVEEDAGDEARDCEDVEGGVEAVGEEGRDGAAGDADGVGEEEDDEGGGSCGLDDVASKDADLVGWQKC